MEKLAVAILVLLVLSACASSPKTSPSQVSQPAATTSQTQAKSEALSQTEIEARKLAAQLQEMQKKSVYFDFDKYGVEPLYRDVVQQQADFIKGHGNETVTLQGNADERGSNEYNLALGERRASAVRKYLALSGIPENRIKVISLGEEKPRLTCHEETCWKENRRVDFVYNPDPQ